ncbi:ferredoxin FdxA [Hydrogenophaga sp. PML113]|uniref:ferredoxin FdxA n=1 Tax=Hydrogenophaga sp. PML113 TaxID=1899350 RepID=UPI0009F7302C|nr:ferredoxin FdxA [Hydrogenophaga sp. PML113]
MSYVVTESCIRCKYTDCVAICPVDAFREGRNMLVIDPAACIDCGVCEPECPAGAIVFDMDAAPLWRDLNQRMAAQWPVISEPKRAPPDADLFRGEADKYARYFTETAA